MNHREAAEKLLDQVLYLPALVHAVLALVDRLEQMPMVRVVEDDEGD